MAVRRYAAWRGVLLLGIGLSALAAFQSGWSEAYPHQRVEAPGAVAGLPLVFEENRGQAAEEVRFVARGPGYSLFLTDQEAVFRLHAADGSTADAAGSAGVIRMRLDGRIEPTPLEGERKLRGTANHYRGVNPENWRTGIPLYGKVRRPKVYPGIDLVYYGNPDRLEYDFILSTGADPEQIRMRFEGAASARIVENGDLLLSVGGGELRQEKPFAYQEAGGRRIPVPVEYRLFPERRPSSAQHPTPDAHTVGFRLGAYDPARPLVIDPVLEYSTYLGGSVTSNASGNDDGNGISVDAEGSAYIAGRAESTNFPVRNAFDSTLGSGASGKLLRDGFIAKLSPDGSQIEYATYVGGSQLDVCFSIDVDRYGNAYVSGRTASTDFPTTRGAFQETDPSGAALDPILVKLGPNGELIYSSYFGGESYDIGHGIAAAEERDANGTLVGVYAVLTGETRSRNFPLKNALQTEYGGGGIDAFISKINLDPSDSTPGPTDPNDLIYSSYLGGSGDESGYGMTTDAQGNPCFTGITYSTDFPTTAAAFDTRLNGRSDIFVTRVDPDSAGAASLLYSTFLGGGGDEIGFGAAADAEGHLYVAGETTSADIPTTSGAFDRVRDGASDGYVARLDPSGAGTGQLIYATYLGGSGADWCRGIGLDQDRNAYVTGATSSGNFPRREPIQSDMPSQDIFLTALSPAGNALLYSTYLGGSGADEGRSVAVDREGAAYITGETNSSNLLTTPGALDRQYGRDGDAFVMKVAAVAAAVFSLTAGPSPVETGSPITVQWTAPAGRPAGDWIGLFPVGAGNDGHVWSRTTGGAQSGSFTLAAPAQAGDYQFRYLQSGTLTDVARSNTVAVRDPAPPPPPGDGITFRAGSAGNNGTGARSLVLSLPAGTQPGDLLLAAVTAASGSVSFTPPTGWVQVINASEGGALRTIVYRRVTGSSEPPSYTWSFSAQVAAAGALASYSGVSPTSPIDAADGYGNATSTVIEAPGVTTTVPDTLLVNVATTGTATTVTPPSGMTERVEGAGGGLTVCLSDQPRPTAGATGKRFATAGSAAMNVGHNIALRR